MSEQLLALRDDWRYATVDAGFDLPPGEEKVLFSSNKHGYVLYGGIFTNDPNLTGVIELETGQGKSRQEITLAGIYALGLTSPTNGWFVSKFDPIAKLYGVIFAPAEGRPFYKGLKFSVLNSTASQIKIFKAGLLAIEFTK